LSYNVYVHGQKSYNGVAILSKFPADEVITKFDTICSQDQARIIQISLQSPIGFCSIMSVYAPNGSFPGSDKFEMKLGFYDDFIAYLHSQKSIDNKLIIGGDFNIAPFDIDVYSAQELHNTTCFTNQEKKRLRTILNSGFEDLYRVCNPRQQEFTWWDYRAGNFEKNRGLRIDTILASSNLVDNLHSCSIHYSWRSKDKPSDHVPVVAEFGV
jgi:exodeoxyribonuclease-3